MSDYYKEHYKEFIDNTFKCDMSELYAFFESHLNGTGTILDLGFGSGRDSLYFKNKGYDVYAIDPLKEFCDNAAELGIYNIFQMKAQDINFTEMFDGIWACASLLHISSNELPEVFIKCAKALKKNGVMYVSFKYGEFEGDRGGRYYTDMTENRLKKIIEKSNLKIIETIITSDVRENNQTKWLNCILKRCG